MGRRKSTRRSTPAGTAPSSHYEASASLLPSDRSGREHVIDPVREFIRAFNERDLDAFVAVLDPGVELHSMRGVRKGRGGGAALGDAAAGRGAADDRARAALRGRGAGERHRGGADPPPLELGRGRLGGGGRRDGLGLRAARQPGAELASLRGPRRGAARRRLRPHGIPERAYRSRIAWSRSPHRIRRQPTPGAGRSSTPSSSTASW